MISHYPTGENHAGDVTTRVACLATHGGHAGGAAIAMERLAAGMRLCGARVDVITRDEVHPTRLPEERRLRRIIKRSRAGDDTTMFTLDWPTWDIVRHPAVTAAAWLNVHWVAGFLGAESIRRLAATGKPVLWTLHDMRPFTGGCHYTAGCTGFTTGCAACPQLEPAFEATARRAAVVAARRLRGVPIVFVTPSRWLAGELARSSLFDPAAHAIDVIPNGIDLDRFAPAVDRVAVRRRIGLPERGLGILLGSVSLGERRKGIPEAVAAIEGLASLASIASPPFVVTYGAKPPTIRGLVVRHLGPRDEDGVIEAIHACDVHLTMTREDNLPNTVMEAMACGVPVVATAVGGLPDMVTHGVDGWLVPRADSDAAASVLGRLAAEPGAAAAAGGAARLRAVREWDRRAVAGRYLGLAADRLVSAIVASNTAHGLPILRHSPAAAATLTRRSLLRHPLRGLRRLGLLPPRGLRHSIFPRPRESA